MNRERLKYVATVIAIVAFGVWGIPLLPDWASLLLVVSGAILMLVEFARWLDRNAY